MVKYHMGYNQTLVSSARSWVSRLVIKLSETGSFMKKMRQSFLLGLAAILVACPNPIVPTKPVITAFTAIPASLPVGGGSSSLAWTVTGADSLSIDQSVGVVTGTQKGVNLSSTTTFTLSATNSVGVTTQAVTITVAQPPEPPANQISGMISPWTRGSRDLKGEIYSNSTTTTVSGTLRQNGEISLTLPDQTANLQPIFNPPNSLCVGNVVVTPTDAIGTSLGRIAVRTAPTPFASSKLSGYLYRVNNTSFASGSMTDLKQIAYIYMNKATTVQGSCSYGNEVQEFDLNLKQGWNTVLSESTSANKVRLSNSTIPSDVIWRFVPAGKISTNSTKSNVEVGETTQFVAFGEDNYPFPGSDLNWVSASSGLEVNAEGVATAKALGTHFVTARLKIVPSINATNGVTVSSFLAAGATYNLEDNALGTAIRLSFGDGLNLYPVSITGPRGWNNNQVLTITKTNTSTTSEVILNELTAVAGTYTVKRGEFLAGGATFNIDTNNKLPIAKNLVVTNGVSPEATLLWHELPQQSVPLQYATEVTDAQTGQVIRARESASSLTQASYNGLNLDKSKTYKFRVYAQSRTNTPTDVFLGASVASIVLDFRPVIAKLDYQGGFVNAGNTVVVTGSNFASTNEVFLGTIPITNFTVSNENTLSFVVPNLPIGTVDLTIKNSKGLSSTSPLTKYSTFAVTEFSGFKPYKLLKGLNGEIHFLEWDATNYSNVVRLSKVSANASITRVTIPNADHDDVNNMALSPNGDVWIAFRQKLVKVSPNGVVSEVVIPNSISAANIAFGSDGLLWFTNRGSGKIGRIETNGTSLVEFTDPRLNSFSTNDQFQLGSDGNLWFTQSGKLGVITPAGAITWISLSVSSGQSPLLVDGNSILVRDLNRLITRVRQPSEFVKYGACDGNDLVMANNGFLWCGGSDFSTEKHLRRLDLLNTNPIVQSIFINATNQINEVIGDSNGKIWFTIGDKIGVFFP
jgi:uncharacterized protein YaaQ